MTKTAEETCMSINLQYFALMICFMALVYTVTDKLPSGSKSRYECYSNTYMRISDNSYVCMQIAK